MRVIVDDGERSEGWQVRPASLYHCVRMLQHFATVMVYISRPLS